MEPDAVAVIVRDGDGNYRVSTSHHQVSTEATWGMLWGALFGRLFFAPVLGMAVGSGLDDLMRRIEAMGIDSAFERGVRDMLQPGTSALFMFVSSGAAAVVETLSGFGGSVASATLAPGAQAAIQDHLHGDPRSA